MKTILFTVLNVRIKPGIQGFPVQRLFGDLGISILKAPHKNSY